MDVSRETQVDLEVFHDLLLKWNKTINLVSKATVDDIMERHIADSLQIMPFLSGASTVADLGSGGGLPAVPCAICSKNNGADRHFTMIESDGRKAAFLRTVQHTLSLSATILHSRVEAADQMSADVVTARALAPLGPLLGLAHRHLRPGGACVFLKGAQADTEIATAREGWNFKLDQHTSITNPDASILVLSEISPK